VTVAHNMSRRTADPRYVKAITNDKRLETLFLHMDRAGMGVSLKKRAGGGRGVAAFCGVARGYDAPCLAKLR